MIKASKKRYKKLKDTLNFMGTIRLTEKSLFQGHKVMKSSVLAEAQQLHAGVYLKRNFISEQDISADGRMHHTADPHQKHSTYFVVRDRATERIVATSRQIELDNTKLCKSFPLLEKANIEPEWLDYIMDHRLDRVVEISGLAKLKDVSSMAPLYLYRQMWHHSLRQKHDLWLMACDVRLFQRLKILLGDAIIQIGEETGYQGGNVIPAVVKPKQSLHALIKSALDANFMQRYVQLLVVEFFISGLPMHALASTDKVELKKIGVLKRAKSIA